MTCTHLFVICARGSRESASYGSDASRRRAHSYVYADPAIIYPYYYGMITLITIG